MRSVIDLRANAIALTDGFALLFQLSVAVVFLYSALVHLVNPYQFYGAVLSYQVASESVAILVAAFFPPLELIVGLLLFFRYFEYLTLAASLALFSCFSALHWYVVASGRSIACGCFGSESDEVISTRSALMVSFVALGLVTMLLRSIRSSPCVTR